MQWFHRRSTKCGRRRRTNSARISHPPPFRRVTKIFVLFCKGYYYVNWFPSSSFLSQTRRLSRQSPLLCRALHKKCHYTVIILHKCKSQNFLPIQSIYFSSEIVFLVIIYRKISFNLNLTHE